VRFADSQKIISAWYVPIYYYDKSHDNFQSNVVINKLSAPAPILPPDSLAINKIKNFGKTTKNMFFWGVALVGTGILLILLDPIKMFFGGIMTVAGVLAILLGLVLLTVVMWLALFYLIKKYEYNRYHDPKI
jgi:drug/metabolite transporter (DMT)-like permease